MDEIIEDLEQLQLQEPVSHSTVRRRRSDNSIFQTGPGYQPDNNFYRTRSGRIYSITL